MNKTKLLIATFVIALSFVRCAKDDIPYSKTNIESTFDSPKDLPIGFNDGPIILGEKLENPYSVENMQIAYDNLLKRGIKFQPDFRIYTSHFYVRFLPNDESELDILIQDESLELYDFPLDYQIRTRGISYHDPSLPKESITWQYCAVQSDYKFPDIRYEILSPLFIPEEIPEFNITSQTQDAVYDLVTEALRITNNLDDPEEDNRWSNWYPSGTITVFDDIVGGQIPAEGVLVRARHWFKMRWDYTNSNGYFETGAFKRKVNYLIIWRSTGDYLIRDGYLFQAYYDGPKRRSPWNLDISSAKSLRIATIHRAAYRYHYLNIDGLKRPNVWTTLRICYRDKIGTGVNWGNNWMYFIGTPGLIPNIHIYGKNSTGGYHSTDVLFSTTVHELGHASHIELMNGDENQFSQVSVQIRESWANTIEWYISRIEYVSLGFPNYDSPIPTTTDRDNMQNWTSIGSHLYTPLFIDVLDNYNQSTNRGTQPTNRCPDGGWFNSMHCYIGSAPSGESAFIYADNFYHTPIGCCNCPQPGSWYDGANCYGYTC